MCFTLEVSVVGEWAPVATSAGVGAQQCQELTIGITRTAELEKTGMWSISATRLMTAGISISKRRMESTIYDFFLV